MNIGLIKLLATACSVLIAVVCIEWIFGEYVERQLFSGLEIESGADYDALALPRIETGRRNEDSFSDMVARPLFIEGRRPTAETAESAGEAAAEAALENFDWQLTGVYTRDRALMGLFSRAQKVAGQANHVKLAVGGEIAGWRLVEIYADKAVLEANGNRRELILRKPKPTQLPQQPKSPALPRRQPTNPHPTQNADENKE